MLFHFFLLSDNYSSWHKVATHDGVQQGGKPSVHCSVTYQHLYSVDQKKPNRERLNVFCFHSTRVPIPVLYPFRTRSISVPCRFSIRFVLFCSHSVSIPLVSFLELVQKNEVSQNPFTRLVTLICISWSGLKLSSYGRIRTVNLNFCGENVSPDTRKTREDGIVTSRPVSKSFSETIQSDR